VSYFGGLASSAVVNAAIIVAGALCLSRALSILSLLPGADVAPGRMRL
jgi:hypothetical protein